MKYIIRVNMHVLKLGLISVSNNIVLTNKSN